MEVVSDGEEWDGWTIGDLDVLPCEFDTLIVISKPAVKLSEKLHTELHKPVASFSTKIIFYLDANR